MVGYSTYQVDKAPTVRLIASDILAVAERKRTMSAAYLNLHHPSCKRRTSLRSGPFTSLVFIGSLRSSFLELTTARSRDLMS
jgi:hypothetical protein